MSISIVSKKCFQDLFDKVIMPEHKYFQDIKSYLDKKSLKKICGGVLPQAVYVRDGIWGAQQPNLVHNEENDTWDTPIHYNKAYIEYWGKDKDIIFGDIVIRCNKRMRDKGIVPLEDYKYVNWR